MRLVEEEDELGFVGIAHLGQVSNSSDRSHSRKVA
jgi:hypothetical protein